MINMTRISFCVGDWRYRLGALSCTASTSLCYLVFLVLVSSLDVCKGLICPLCGAGGGPIASPDNPIPPSLFRLVEDTSQEEISSCSSLEMLLSVFDDPTLVDCDVAVFHFLGAYCGCPGTTPPATTCPGVCGDGGAYTNDPSADVSVLGITGFDTTQLTIGNFSTCGEIDFFSKYADQLGLSNIVDCNSISTRNIMPNFCGCEDAPPFMGEFPACFFCGDDTMAFGTPEARPSILEGASCRQIEEGGIGGIIAPDVCQEFSVVQGICGGCIDVTEQPSLSPSSRPSEITFEPMSLEPSSSLLPSSGSRKLGTRSSIACIIVPLTALSVFISRYP